MSRNKLTKCNEYMFETVVCKEYMRKVNDGRFIEKPDKELQKLIGVVDDNYYYCDTKKETREVVQPEDWGGSDFIKTYYERTAKEFCGIVVGMKMIVVKAELFCDVEYYGPDCIEQEFVNKKPTETMKALVVAYGCNRTRLVPMDGFSILKGE